MMDCFGSGRAPKLAEIAAATVLAGELSFGAALAAGGFVEAHETLGRNRPAEETP
jgi:hydroxymethylglutaryl-CoA reductase (NADPH)